MHPWFGISDVKDSPPLVSCTAGERRDIVAEQETAACPALVSEPRAAESAA